MSDRDDEWEVEDVEATKPVGVVVSVRVPQDVAAHLQTEARRRGVRMSVLAREAIEAFLEGAPLTATVDFTVSSADAPVTLYTGRSSVGRTTAALASLHSD